MPDPPSAALGEFIIRCGMARFPNNPAMLTLYANFLIEARKDGQASRTQLQLAVKNSPGAIERYFIYVSQELAKKLKSEGDGLDLMGYVEFQRNYRFVICLFVCVCVCRFVCVCVRAVFGWERARRRRCTRARVHNSQAHSKHPKKHRLTSKTNSACVRAHKLALQSQRHFWHALLHDSVAFKDLQRSFSLMDAAEKQATQVYRRVMERYPGNGKLLKIYGRFLEHVRNDPWSASKYYAEVCCCLFVCCAVLCYCVLCCVCRRPCISPR